jgi:hypothetical protein
MRCFMRAPPICRLGDLAHRHAGRQQGHHPQPVGVLHVLHAPGRLAVAGLEPGLERLDVLAVDAARLLDMDLEARALRCAVVARPPQAERAVEHVRCLPESGISGHGFPPLLRDLC